MQLGCEPGGRQAVYLELLRLRASGAITVAEDSDARESFFGFVRIEVGTAAAFLPRPRVRLRCERERDGALGGR